MDTNPIIYIYESEDLAATNYSNSLAQASRLVNSSSKIRLEISEGNSDTTIAGVSISGGTMSYVNDGYDITPNNNNPFDPITIFVRLSYDDD